MKLTFRQRQMCAMLAHCEDARGVPVNWPKEKAVVRQLENRRLVVVERANTRSANMQDWYVRFTAEGWQAWRAFDTARMADGVS